MVAFFAVPGTGSAMAELDDYSFEAQVGEKTTWNVTRRLGDGGSVVSNATVFDAVVKARNDLKQSLQTESTAMGTELTEVDRQLGLIAAEQKQDVDAMAGRIEELQALVADYESQLVAKSGEFQNLSVNARIIQDERSSRRQDVTRLRLELEELRTHQYELEQLHRTLVDQLLRIRLDNHHLKKREDQIRQQLTR